MNYQELKNAIIEVIRTNGNEEITGEVLQFVLLEMVSSLGKDFQFAGVATPQTEIIERDDKVAWVLGAGTYENFGIPFTVAVDEIAFVLYNGTYRVQKVKTGVIVDDTLTRDGQNPVKGGAIYAEFDKLRAAGYLFAGVATPSLLPPANLTEKIFYLATQGGEYPNLDNITLQRGINIIRFDGTSWIGESLIAITDEVIDSNVSLITAAGVYSGLSGKVDKVEGMGLSQNSYTNTEKSKLGALPTAQELVQMLGGKQDVLTFDTTPTLNSQNPVTSDGIQRAIEAILILIPSAATALNQLADKSFVNSTVATASATFRGTYNLVLDLSLAVAATRAQIAAALAGAVSGADNNDYAFVQIPTSAGTPTEIRVTERYKFNGETWAYEYDLNNSGFTAAQWEAINSAITSALVTKLSNLPDATQLANLFAGKQNTLTFDNAPVSGSSNPVKSGGIYDAIAAITAVIPSTATSSNKLVDANALTAYVTGIIGALDASFDLTSADGHVTLKMTQVDGVITTLQIITSDIASAQALTTLSGQVSTNADDIAALQALYNALQQSAPQIIEPTDTWPVANPSATVIYRVIDRVNTPPQYYSDYMFKANDLTTPVLMATYNNAIDAVPTAGSHNLVESGGVQNELALGAVYDVSAKNPTAGPNYDGKIESLAALLSDANLNTLIPDAYRKGGMSIKFVQISDNKYVQFRYMGTSTDVADFTDVANWQGVDNNIIAGSPNLAKSGVLNGMVIKAPVFTNGFIDTHDVYHESNDYRCSDFLPLDLVYSIILNDTGSLESKTMTLCLYDKDKNIVRSPTINFANFNDIFVINKETYPQVYFRFWGKTEVIQLITLKWIGSKVYELNDDVESLKGIKGDVLQLKQDVSNLEERLYVDITGDFENGFVDNSGHPHDSDSYSRSKHIKSSDVSRIIIRDDNVTSCQINLFQTDDWTAPVGKILNLGKDIDFQAAISQFSNANYFVIWFNESSPSLANEYTDFIPLHSGDIQELQKNVGDLQEDVENLSVKKSPSGLIYHNGCKSVDDFYAADKGNDYQNLTSSITVVQSGISIPYGTGKWTWVNKDVRNNKKTHIIDFIPNGCTSVKIGSFGFHGGANGINEGVYFNIDISNNVISCSNGQSANFSFTNNSNYRIYLYQEDKHTELSVIDMKSGDKSTTIYFNGTTTNNDGLFYDTWALNPIGASVIITQYEIFAKNKKPFLSIFGDSITLGFNATVSGGLNHNKFAYLVGEATTREYTVTGRGGATFAVLYGSTIQGIPNLSSLKFDGMLYSELPAYMSSYVMLTMGTNGGGTYNQYKEFVEYVLSLGLIPIVNTLPIRADGQDDKNIPANVAANKAIMQIWKDYNIHGARFDLATSLNNDGETIDPSLYIDDNIHPNDAGHAAMAARVMLDCPELFY